MELNPHDLLILRDFDDLMGISTRPQWVDEVLEQSPLVVVRRSPFKNDRVPVGVRGKTRDQRFAATILSNNIAKQITPEEFTANKVWRTNKHIRETEMFSAIELVDNILAASGLDWGPTGSLGFELASGMPTITNTSDLDIVVRVPNFLSTKIAQQIVERITKVSVKVDIQLETPNGAVALFEYARDNSKVLLRTMNGPCLVTDPWTQEKKLEG